MANIVSNHILKVLCNNQCCLEFQHLDGVLRQSFTVDERLLRRAVLDSARYRVVDEDSAERALSPGALIIAVTSLRICKDPAKCARCEDLHLCRYLVCGKCRFGNKCKNCHDLKSAHNSTLLKNKNLQFLEEAQLFQLLLLNDPSLVPEICSHYNKGNGEHGSCKYQTSCTNLHVCQHFLQDDCKFGAACKRAHNFDATAMKILNGRGFSPENIRTLQKIYKNKLLLNSQTDKSISKGAEKALAIFDKQVKRQHSSSSVSEADRNEICLYFVRKGCSFKEKCVRVHHGLPYKWEILDKDGVTWKHFPNEEDVESAYCNPDNNTSFGPLPVDFTLMMCGERPVRRLSTASSVTKPPHFILTTEWLWYWKDDQGQWIEYGQGEDEKLLKSISSKALENVYLSEIETEIPFNLGGNNYVLNIKDMYQQNLRYKTKREVRRRPRFVSVQDVKGKSKSDASETTGSNSVEVPGHWDKAALPSFSYTIVPLSSSAPDYKSVTLLFKRTMSSSTIHSIKRVQNPSLWRVFKWQREQMKEKNGGGDIDERYLFHGTDKSLIDAICEQNFDWRVCGIHGSLYGKGSYFARDAKYSDTYAKSRGGPKTMFVALILVGEFTKGSSSFLRPPQKPQKAGFYDSCVDNPSNPAIFVIFEKYQIYPEYIIEYS
ncbi:protein mono-ADP-ribosyltransferase PARP12-like [Ictalurus furcatus]|uniref:protein mono-ADP-ribosyltransferase PARP12-like n=1 Tax=Ictalurus furcatus TaxID=66913 RepID=UPI00234FF0ED|nr:protein mono-ADP-ribosyltransferase PARP12-like [Ictalurus furcatus]